MAVPDDIQASMNLAIESIKAGKKTEAVEVLKRVIKQDPHYEPAWLWLSAAVPDDNDKIFCLEKAIEINPYDHNAQKALEQLKSKSIPTPSLTEIGVPAGEPSKKAIPEKRNDHNHWLILMGVLLAIVAVVIIVSSLSNAVDSPESVALSILFHRYTTNDITPDAVYQTSFFPGDNMDKGIWSDCDTSKDDCGWTILSSTTRDGTRANTKTVTIGFRINNPANFPDELWAYFVLEKQNNRWVDDCSEGDITVANFPNLCYKKQ